MQSGQNESHLMEVWGNDYKLKELAASLWTGQYMDLQKGASCFLEPKKPTFPTKAESLIIFVHELKRETLLRFVIL